MLELPKADVSDCQFICELSNELQMIHHEGFPDRFTNHLSDITDIKNEISEENKYYIVKYNGMNIGYLKMYYKVYKETLKTRGKCSLVIEELIISKNNRNKGIGKEIMKRIEKEYNDIDEIEIPVYAFNDSAISFYKNNGYEEYVKRVRKRVKV